MKFGVKFLAILLVSVICATMLTSCFSGLNGDDVASSDGSSDNIIVIPPNGDHGGNNGNDSGNNGNDGGNNGNTSGSVVIENITAPYIADVHVSTSVEPDEENKVPSGGVNLDSSLASATIPGGVQLEEGAKEVVLTINGIEDSKADVELLESEVSSSFDVHVSGVAENNLVPMEIKLAAAAAKGLNSTSIKLYHVENGETVAMTLIPSSAEFTDHNQFKYNPATGDITLSIASFSEIMVVSDTENAWNGTFDYSWYDANPNADEFIIASAEQLAAFGAIVGGMQKVTGRNDNVYTYDGYAYTDTYDDGTEYHHYSFAGKTVTLIADINLGDKESENNSGIIFYPIGYYNEDGTYEKTNKAITSGLRSFEGTFDGNGHTISNFYQNTWEMKGDHNWYDGALQYYRDGMGLFGRVYGATVKNLTVENFSSDGEIATTGVIAAYADGATFENISIFNCNPRVYNIGNGGIVGCVGWYAKEADLKTTFKNITVDNSNKISALWGSYDVACGGIVGQYYPTSGQSSAEYPVNGGIDFTNCHVSAVMDVYNDVCANYQYYAYRYTGMFIGSVRENVTGEDGRVYPDMTGITAKYCTVHFGTWNDYYYCEIIDNTTASYTHDYQMSRLTEIKAIDGTTITYLDGTTDTVPESGRANYVIVDYTKGHGTENATCYHFKDGEVWTHDMGGIQEGIDENGDGQDDLKEDKQHIYLEFNNLVTGYGWGVTSKGLEDYNGVNNKDIIILEGEVEGSVEKFESTGTVEFGTGSNPTVSQIFQYITNCGVEIKNDQVIVTVSSVTGSTAGATLNPADSWEESTLALEGIGALNVTISDYYYCKSTTVTINVTAANKFEYKYGNEEQDDFKDFLLRVGNQNALAIGLLFDDIAPSNIGIDANSVEIKVLDANNNEIDFDFVQNKNDWKASTISFAGYTGIAEITIEDGTSYPCTVKVEVVNGTNAISAASATSGNIVLLNDAGLSSLTISGRYAFYGNGFTLTYTGNGQYLNNGLKQGVVTVSENGTLDNVKIVAPVYPYAYMYYSSAVLGDAVTSGPSTTEGDRTRYHYQLSAVALSGNGTISNCYIYGGRNNIFINTGDVTIKDTILECGTVANVQIQSNNSHTITLENVTTIQHQVNPTVWNEDTDKAKVMLGAGILVGPETSTNPSIVLNGAFKQYNWVNEDDKNAVSDEAAKTIIDAALDAADYNHTINGKKSSNLGIIYMNAEDAPVINNTNLPYEKGEISISSATGTVYSLKGATGEQIYFDYADADRSTVNGYYVPQFSYTEDLGGQQIPDNGGDEFLYRTGDTIYVMFPSGESKEINLATLVNISKYTNKEMELEFTCVNSKGEAQTITDNKVALSDADTYTITYSLVDTWFYDKDGNAIKKSITYSWTVTLNVSLKDTGSPDAYFAFNADSQKMGYYKPTIGDVKQYLPFLAGLKIYDYNGQTEYLRFDGDNDFNKVASITITGYTSNEAYIEVKLTDGGVINTKFLARADSGGGSTYTGKIKTSNNTIYFVSDSGTSNKDTTTTAAYWYVDYYKFTGNNGVAIQSAQQTFNSTGSSASTPSGSFNTTIKYTVSYDANSGRCGQTTGYATSAATAVTLPTPTRSGYIFAGWYTSASGGTRVGGAGESYTPNANITLYAQWGKPCNVTYNANGGTCGTASEKYTGTALTLPTPTRDGYWFIGWYDAAEGGNKIGDAGTSYHPTDEITLYAQWQEKIEYTVTYNANGGSCGEASATYQGTALTLPTPTYAGYKFNGWYTSASGGTKIGDAGTTYTPNANITLYAQWEKLPTYTITIGTQSNATVSVDKNSTYAGDTVSVTVSFSQSQNRSLKVKSADGSELLSKNADGTYTFTMPNSNVTIEAISEKPSCVTGDTLVTLADGTQKRIDAVTTNDMLLAWNHFTGNYEAVPAAIIFNHGYDNNTVIKLNFSDGTQVKVINLHQFFDAELNKYVSIDETTVADYVGHGFVKQSGDSYTTVALDSYEISKEYIETYGIISALHYNILVEGMFSTDFMLEDYDLFNYFAFGEGVMFDAEMMQSDIEKYGLYTYEDFADYLTYEQFVAFNVQYFKIAVGKGNYTYEGILDLIDNYLNVYPSV